MSASLVRTGHPRGSGGIIDLVRASDSIAISAARASSAYRLAGDASRTCRGPSEVFADIANRYRSMLLIAGRRDLQVTVDRIARGRESRGRSPSRFRSDDDPGRVDSEGYEAAGLDRGSRAPHEPWIA